MTNERSIAYLMNIRTCRIKVLLTSLKQQINEFDEGFGVEYLILRCDLFKEQFKEFNLIQPEIEEFLEPEIAECLEFQDLYYHCLCNAERSSSCSVN
ncbi:hypothetical protein GWI33_014745 [Rhynchophorus ferrugineus]|uniref:Uncharacterized protein n=1 Tax=Rhynchophorus ferrugineus TaxID=354439 RepID=A0A834M572_RHYFE|nr:hypothetical protein GWI33_014745 [Rhynchophorus ferrugineus]